MSENSTPIRVDCFAWQKNYYAGKFVEWIRVGKGYILIKDGMPIKSHTRYQSTVRGDSVNTVLLPVGETPAAPELQPKRRDGSDEPEEDFNE
jgi:hypothetical protein